MEFNPNSQNMRLLLMACIDRMGELTLILKYLAHNSEERSLPLARGLCIVLTRLPRELGPEKPRVPVTYIEQTHKINKAHEVAPMMPAIAYHFNSGLVYSPITDWAITNHVESM